MSDTFDREPLWQIMKDAYMVPPPTATEEQCYAAEMRAIADAMVMALPNWGEGEEDVRNWLLSEADRAEVA
jgi:hypothetical protein